VDRFLRVDSDVGPDITTGRVYRVIFAPFTVVYHVPVCANWTFSVYLAVSGLDYGRCMNSLSSGHSRSGSTTCRLLDRFTILQVDSHRLLENAYPAPPLVTTHTPPCYHLTTYLTPLLHTRTHLLEHPTSHGTDVFLHRTLTFWQQDHQRVWFCQRWWTDTHTLYYTTC